MDTFNENLQVLLMNFMAFLPKLVGALVIFVLSLFFAGVISRAIRRALKVRDVDPELTILIGKLSRWSVIILGTAAALGQVDFDLTAFLAGLGIVGFTVGFAIQDVSKNFVAGLLLLLQQPFDLGDTITVGDYTGEVKTVDLRATEIRTLDGLYVLIPNADVFTSPIVNLSRATERRAELVVGVSYDSDLGEVQRVALDAIRDIDGFLLDPVPRAVFHTFAASTVDLTVYYWYDTSVTNPLVAKDQGVAAIKTAFDAAGIEMPYPIQTVLAPDS